MLHCLSELNFICSPKHSQEADFFVHFLLR
jgi:hypothetical protein